MAILLNLVKYMRFFYLVNSEMIELYKTSSCLFIHQCNTVCHFHDLLFGQKMDN